MVEIKPEDLIVTVYPTQPKGRGGMYFGQHESGIQVYHKPSGVEVKIDRHRSQHKNKHEAIIILQDLLTEFDVEDIVVTGDGIAEIIWIWGEDCRYKLEDLKESDSGIDYIAHTEEGYRYKWIGHMKLRLINLEKEYEHERNIIVDEIKKWEK